MNFKNFYLRDFICRNIVNHGYIYDGEWLDNLVFSKNTNWCTNAAYRVYAFWDIMSEHNKITKTQFNAIYKILNIIGSVFKQTFISINIIYHFSVILF